MFAPTGFTAQTYLGGPPAYPNVRDGTYPSGFAGYPMGFTSFNLVPIAGTYTLTLNVPTGFDSAGNPTSGNVTTSANLASLPTFPRPTFTLDGAGGGTVSVVVPAGVTESLIIVRNGIGSCYPGANGAPAYFTFLTTTTGAQSFTLPDTIGPTFGSQTSTRTICSGDSYRVYAGVRLRCIRRRATRQQIAVTYDRRSERTGRHHAIARADGNLSVSHAFSCNERLATVVAGFLAFAF